MSVRPVGVKLAGRPAEGAWTVKTVYGYNLIRRRGRVKAVILEDTLSRRPSDEAKRMLLLLCLLLFLLHRVVVANGRTHHLEGVYGGIRRLLHGFVCKYQGTPP